MFFDAEMDEISSELNSTAAPRRYERQCVDDALSF